MPPLLRERGAPAPYQQIREILRKEIVESMSPGDRIAAERDLSRRFDANRATISRAIASLVNEGLLVRRVGRGTFVSTGGGAEGRARTRAVGLVVPYISGDFPAGVVRSAVKSLRDDSYRAVLFDSDDSSVLEATEIDRLGQEGVDGGLIMPVDRPENAELLARASRMGPPLVFLDRRPLGVDVDLVATDSHWGSYTAVTRLIERGHKRIAHFTWLVGRASTAIADRRKGYEDALRDHGIEVDPDLICPPAMFPDAQSSFKHIISYLRQGPEPVTAILGLNDTFTLGAIAGCDAIGLSTPGDVEVAGFFDGPLPPMGTTRIMRIVQNQEEIGRQAVELLMKRIDGNGPAGPQTILIRPDIIE